MLCHFYSIVVPFTGNHRIIITHLTVAGIGPTAKGVNADDIIILIFFINLCLVGIGCIYCIRLTFHVVIAICWQIHIRWDIIRPPVVNHVMGCNLLLIVFPRTLDGKVAIAHGAACSIPAAKTVDTGDIAIGVRSGYLGVCGIGCIYCIGLTLQVDLVINRHIFAIRCVDPAVGNAIACYGQLWRFVQAFAQYVAVFVTQRSLFISGVVGVIVVGTLLPIGISSIRFNAKFYYELFALPFAVLLKNQIFSVVKTAYFDGFAIEIHSHIFCDINRVSPAWLGSCPACRLGIYLYTARISGWHKHIAHGIAQNSGRIRRNRGNVLCDFFKCFFEVLCCFGI